MGAGQVTVRLNLNKDGYSAGMTAARREAQQLATAVQATGHTTVSQMQAASAAIRTLEGGMSNSIRAAERFISTIPGVGKALQAAFPVIGGIALAGVFAKIGTEAAKAIETVLKMPVAITNGFRQLNLEGQTANDTLRITNDRLENEIAKLQGKPQNNLKLAIDEARLAADKMAESLDRDNSKIKELLSQNAVPWWAGFLGKSGTSVVGDTVNAQNQHLSDLAAQMNIAQHENRPDDAASLRVAIDAMRSQYLQGNAKDIADHIAQQKLPGGLDQSAPISILQGQQASLYNQFDQESELGRNTGDEAQLAKVKAAKDLLEAQKQAAAALVQEWRKELDEQKVAHDMTLNDESRFWLARAQLNVGGGRATAEAIDEANKLMAEVRGQNMRAQKEFDTTAGAPLGDRFDLSKGDTGAMQAGGRQAADYLKNLNEGIALQRQNANALAEASLQMAVATGQMGKLDAAQAQAALHTQEYQQAMERLKEALANAANMPAGFERDSMLAGLNNQGTQMAGQRGIQAMQDQQAVASQQLGPALSQALGKMANDWTNMTDEIVQVLTKTVSSFNDDVVKAMTGQGKKGDFSKTFTQAGQGLLKSSLQSAEGSILKALGLGGVKKADGSQANPYYVLMAQTGGAGGSAMSKILQGTGGWQGSGANSGDQGQGGPQGGSGSNGGSGSVWMQLLRDFFPKGGQGQGGGDGGGGSNDGGDDSDDSGGPFQGLFAGGGDVLANRPAMVGERGPEMFVPHSAGTIVPNHALGGGGDTHFHIDARGATDPAAVHAAVMRAAPHIVSAAVQTQHQTSKRTPQGR